MSDRLLFADLYREPLTAEARARATDPVSSHLAAERISASGEATRQRERVVNLVCRFPGLTSKQLAAKCDDLDRFQIARRLPEAEAAGLIERRAGAGKGREVIWFPKNNP